MKAAAIGVAAGNTVNWKIRRRGIFIDSGAAAWH